ncbi:DUF6262 family protein [Sulfurimonas sp.]|uniref:DUF6262 family protein n=1 Tax=Sulfurimonas sp. TaxID=2022749 RepID=UPI0025D4128E|nr:DUF6262 family protein [Sulfurimonas sp.]
MAKGDSLKKYKLEQKEETRKKLQKIIEELQSSGDKVSVSNVATLSGTSRANIYANYKDLFEQTVPIDSKIKRNEHRSDILDKNNLIEKLRKDNKQLRDANAKLMDQIVGIKIINSL